MHISLRKMTAGDVVYFQNWWKDKELLALTSGAEPATEEESKEYFEEMMNDVSRIDRMIISEEKVIGHAAFIKKDEPWWEFFIVIGEKEFHGKGYGTEAIRQSLLLVREHDIHSVFLEVRPDNAVAKHVYESCGFKYARILSHKSAKLPVTERWEIQL